jgi:DNA-binding XRE family transcriptional regulator
MITKRAKPGRPSKFDRINLDQVRKLAERGWTDAEMARFVGVTESTWNNWKKKHPEFLESLKEGKAVADGLVEWALFLRAIGFTGPDGKHYPPDVTACIFWLKNRRPDQWRDRPVLPAASQAMDFTVTVVHEGIPDLTDGDSANAVEKDLRNGV